MKKSGSLWILMAAIAFSLGGLLIKLIPYSSLTIASGRCIFSSFVFTIYFIFTKRKFHLNRTIVISALFALLTMLAYIVSNKLTTAANAIVLEYTSSFFVIVFELLYFKKNPNKTGLMAATLIIIGVILVVIDGIKADSLLGIIIALISGATYALVFMANSFEGSDPVMSMYLAHLTCAILFLPNAIKEIDLSASYNIYLILLGVVQSGLGYLLLAIGTSKCEALTASMAASVEPILNPILVTIFYGERMSVLAFIGAFIVLLTNIVYNIISNKQKRISQQWERI